MLVLVIVLVVFPNLITPAEPSEGKQTLERIVSMLWKMIEAFQPDSSTSTSTSTSTSS